MKNNLNMFMGISKILCFFSTLVNGNVCFDAERDSNRDCCDNNIIVSVILRLSYSTLLMPSFNLIDSLFSEILLLLYLSSTARHNIKESLLS